MASDSSSLDYLLPALSSGLTGLGLAPEPLGSRLVDYLVLLVRWNAVYNLTAIRDPAEMVSKHLLDSLSIVPFVRGSVADIGSGAGLPGIPLALALPELAVTTVESNGKKVRFQREVQRLFGLANLRVAESRAESFDPPERFDCLVSRAFGSLAEFARVGGHLLRPGGRLLAMKGADPVDEVAALPAGWRIAATHVLDVPGLDARRHLLAIERDD
ncbi:MAG TPA: 16S rRNA (guanine(527)-N(7))-methyltransferase RsmG [Xanthomonadaceae bacterium]|jgi:16S rRNA (guanine527-N7)-methyltransferase|nr:16S rRNA (guanine(527)-N(7))-methyltransferase RsmG [Xanthomonadaceae bacterium]